jgi:large subunit ribosomal protein L6e
VVCLAHLPSGLLLVAGPFSVNGVPLRRVNPAYVIGTSTTVDVAGVDVAKYDDAFFRKAEKAAAARPGRGGDVTEADAARSAKAPLPAAYLAAQKAVDAALTAKLDADLKGYLGSTFSLQAGDRPHLLKF